MYGYASVRQRQGGPQVADLFTQEELEAIKERASELASEYEDDASLRNALQLLGESANNVIPFLTPPRSAETD
jgi:hypothetical protein